MRGGNLKLLLDFEKKIKDANDAFIEVDSKLINAHNDLNYSFSENNRLKKDSHNLEIKINNKNSELNLLISQIGGSNKELIILNKSVQDLLSNIENLNTIIVNTESKKIELEANIVKINNYLNSLIIKSKEYEQINESLKRKNETIQNEVDKKNRLYQKKDEELKQREQKLELDVRNNTVEKEKIEEAKNKLSFYNDRLNYYYKKLGRNTKINIWQEQRTNLPLKK